MSALRINKTRQGDKTLESLTITLNGTNYGVLD